MFTSSQKEPSLIATNIRGSAKTVKGFGDLSAKKSVETVGSRLKAFAKARFKRLGTFAEAAGINPSQLSDYIADKYIPRGDVLTKFAELGLNVNWLLTGKGEMDDAPPPDPIGIDLRTIDRKAFKSLEALIKSVSEELDKLKPDGEDDEAEELAEP
jgi:transcriptional regulator with XRE-family HTH domain